MFVYPLFWKQTSITTFEVPSQSKTLVKLWVFQPVVTFTVCAENTIGNPRINVESDVWLVVSILISNSSNPKLLTTATSKAMDDILPAFNPAAKRSAAVNNI